MMELATPPVVGPVGLSSDESRPFSRSAPLLGSGSPAVYSALADSQEKLQSRLGYVKVLALGLLLAAVMSSSLMLVAKPAYAGQTFTVNNTGDPLEGEPEFGVCNVQICTLRTAIIAANNNPGKDTIEFNIARPEFRHIISVQELPVITEPSP